MDYKGQVMMKTKGYKPAVLSKARADYLVPLMYLEQ